MSQTRDQLRDRMHTVAIRMMQDRRPVSLTAMRREGVFGDVERMGQIFTEMCETGFIPRERLSRKRLEQTDKPLRPHLDYVRTMMSERRCIAPPPQPKPKKPVSFTRQMKRDYYRAWTNIRRHKEPPNASAVTA